MTTPTVSVPAVPPEVKGSVLYLIYNAGLTTSAETRHPITAVHADALTIEEGDQLAISPRSFALVFGCRSFDSTPFWISRTCF